MNAFIDLVKKRRSIRSYRSDPVPREMIESCIEAVRYAPSASNTQGWRFFVVEGDLKDRLVEEAMGGIVPNKFAATAPVIIVLAMKRSIVTHRLGAAVKGIGYHLIDAGIAGEHFVLQAAELGLGTCWIGWFDEEKARQALGVPEGIRIVASTPLGYPDESPEARPRKSMIEIVHRDRWG